MVYSLRQIHERLMSLNETDLLALLDVEVNGPKRATVIVRLHQRYTTLRAARERRELLEHINAPDTTPPVEHCSA